MGDAAERSIPATPRRREAARREGAGPNAALPGFAVLVVTAVLLLPGWGRTVVPAAAAFMRESFAAAFDAHAHDPVEPGLLLPTKILGPTAALVVAPTAAALCIRFLLDGSSWRLARALPHWRRIDPVAGLGRIISLATLRATLWNGVCLALLVTATGFAAGPLVGLLRSSTPVLEAERPLSALWATLVPVLAAAAAVAAAQWGHARLAFERRLRMTPEEFQDEMRGLEADPKVRLERQRRARPRSPAPDSRSDR